MVFTQRFTPTGVGTGDHISMKVTLQAVHPHGRGDWLKQSEVGRTKLGSPPRAWGLVWCPVSRGRLRRFTPTGVGTGWYGFRWVKEETVHPHGRGDWSSVLDDDGLESGSPPRAWGLALYDQRDVEHYRFTPTGVGTGHFFARERLWQTVHPHGRGDWT